MGFKVFKTIGSDRVIKNIGQLKPDLSPQQFPAEQLPELWPEGTGEVPLKLVNSVFKPKFTNSDLTL